MKSAFALLFLLLTPGLALAGGGCHGDKVKMTAASCDVLETFDAATGQCVLTPSS